MSAEQSVSEAPVEQMAPVSGGEQSNGSGGFDNGEEGQRSSHGMGQSKSSRRRRRKRKGKSAEGSEAGTEPAFAAEVMPGEVIASVQAGAGMQQQRNGRPQSNGQANAQGAGQQGNSQPGNGAQGNAPGTKRWKKKFRDRDRQRPGGDNPGNQASSYSQQGNGQGGFRGPDTHQPGNGGGGFKRKGGGGFGGKQQRQGGSRGGFVGPMDHSYRVVNGNVFDPGESHMSNGGGGGRNGRYQSDSQPIDYSMGRAIPIAEGTPTRIYFFIEDLFFTAKIQETARKLGVKVAFVKNEKEQLATLLSGEEETRPALIVFDLNNGNAKPMTLIPKIRTKLKKSVSILGFLSHLQSDLRAKAIEVGCDTVMPRAAFSQNLPNLLRRYGIEDSDETNYNQ